MESIERPEAGSGLARTPEPPYYAVIFSSRRNAQPGDQFDETDKKMMSLAAQQPGFLGVETASTDIAITVSYWTDEAAIAAWKRDADHAFAQYEGRTRWYDAYELRVAHVTRPQLRAGRAMNASLSPPERVDLDDDTYLRWVTVDDAAALARAVGESLDHLKPWMPWAGAQSADATFQRGRLRNQLEQRERGEEWQYGVFDARDDSLVGTIGIMTRRGPGTLEIGYWLHVDQGKKGRATKAARALAEIGLQLDGINQMIIVCDEANLRSAAIPQRLGFTLERTENRAPEAPGETGRMQIWVFAGPAAPTA